MPDVAHGSLVTRAIAAPLFGLPALLLFFDPSLDRTPRGSGLLARSGRDGRRSDELSQAGEAGCTIRALGAMLGCRDRDLAGCEQPRAEGASEPRLRSAGDREHFEGKAEGRGGMPPVDILPAGPGRGCKNKRDESRIDAHTGRDLQRRRGRWVVRVFAHNRLAVGSSNLYRLHPAMDTRTDIIMRERFGIHSLRPLQQQIIDRVLSGKHALVVMPTGSGKSLCFQLPAVVRHEETGGGVALVFSPLIALMEDQVAALKARGIRATYINSTLKRDERDRRCRKLGEGAYELVYATPERMERENFVQALKRVRGGVTLLAIDEAHCVSKWGHDLRPAYREVGRFRELLGNPVTIALTATATPQVRSDVRNVLGFDGTDMALYAMPVDRENLELRVREVWSEDEKIERMRSIADEKRGTGIVYFTLIKDLERFAERARKEIPGVRVGMYHGKLDARTKKRVYEAFASAHADERLMLLATNAFGMGVDKPDIRYIVHAQMPGSVEAYHQEVGRGGRDAELSVCEMLYMQDDLAIQQEFVDWMNPSPDLLVQISAELERHPHDDVDADDMRLVVLGKGQGGGRVEYAMIALEHMGVIEDSYVPGRYRFVRPIRDEELDTDELHSKRDRDLRRLVDVVQMVRGGEPRAYVKRYFEGD